LTGPTRFSCAGLQAHRITFAPIRRRTTARASCAYLEDIMKTRYTVTLAMLAGFGLGAVAVQGLHAQAKPPIYYIAEIDVSNIDAYTKEYSPIAQATIKAAGGRLLAAGQNVTSVEGAAPTKRVAIQAWDSLEQMRAWRNSAEYKKAREIGDKYAKFRAFTVEGLPQ
jgi:uncharacterized protein (DUF1330 family)